MITEHSLPRWRRNWSKGVELKISVLTICPEQFGDFMKTPLISRALSAGILELDVVDIRDFADGCFRKVDDSPYGGGPGMILRCQPVVEAIEWAKTQGQGLKNIQNRTSDKAPDIRLKSQVIILAPAGKTFTQCDAHRFSELDHLILVCGHFEGIDARIYPYADEILSIGDYILTGGELPAMVIVDSVMRLVDGSMKKESTLEESFENGLLEYPQYTRPADYKGRKVPDVLLSGNHQAIRNWRMQESLRLTMELRPDLLDDH